MKKASVFVVGVIIVAFLVLSSAFVVMFSKYSKTGKIGDKQFSITKAYLDGEKALLYMDTAAEQAYEQAAQEFANNAGMYDSSMCSVNGITIINGNCDFNDDFLKENFEKYLNKAFNQRTKNYEEAYVPFDIYDFYEKDGEIYGIAKNPILVLIGTSSEETNCFPGLLQYFPVSGSYVTDNIWGSEESPDSIKINVKNQNTAVVAVVDGEVKDKGTERGEQFIEINSGENTFHYSHIDISNAMIIGGSVKAGEPIASSSDYIKFRTYRKGIPMNPVCALQRVRQSNLIQGYYYVYPHMSFKPKYNIFEDFNNVMETAQEIINDCGNDLDCIKNNYNNKKISRDLILHVGDCEGNEIIENTFVGFCVESQDEEKSFYVQEETTTITSNPRTGIDKETTTIQPKLTPLQIRFALDTDNDFRAVKLSLPESPLTEPSQKPAGKADILPPEEIPQTEGLIWPTTGTVTQCFGEPTPGTEPQHGGIDIGTPVGTNVVAVADGVVMDMRIHNQHYKTPCESQASLTYASGTTLTLYHADLGIYTRYVHLSGIESDILQKFNQGQSVEVKQGEVIAYVGNSGCSTGPHLDFRISKSDNFAWNVAEDAGDYVPGGCRYQMEV